MGGRRVSPLELEGGDEDDGSNADVVVENHGRGNRNRNRNRHGERRGFAVRGARHRLPGFGTDADDKTETKTLVSSNPTSGSNAAEATDARLEASAPAPCHVLDCGRVTSGVLCALVLLMLAVAVVYPSTRNRLGSGQVSPSSLSSSRCPTTLVADDDVGALLSKVDAEPMKDRCDEEWAGASGGGGCRCANPLRPANYTDRPDWNRAFVRNVELTEDSIARGRGDTLDVVMLGDSLIEFWQATYKGEPLGRFEGNHQVYQRLFDSPGSPLQGLALGVSGDRCNQLLFRVQNGVIEGLHPKVFWVLIGTNDILMTACDADQVVAGNVAIVQELRRRRPDALVVVQSLLPTGSDEALTSPKLYAEVNQRLACFAANYKDDTNDAAGVGRPMVEFVNVTDLFLTPRGTVNEGLLPDGLHPNAAGAELWGRAIVDAVQRIITSRRA